MAAFEREHLQLAKRKVWYIKLWEAFFVFSITVQLTLAVLQPTTQIGHSASSQALMMSLLAALFVNDSMRGRPLSEQAYPPAVRWPMVSIVAEMVVVTRQIGPAVPALLVGLVGAACVLAMEIFLWRRLRQANGGRA